MARTPIPRSDETPAILAPPASTRANVPPSRQRAAVRHFGSTIADGGDGAAGHDPRLRPAASVFASPRLRPAASVFASPRLRPAASVFASPRLRATASVHLRPVIFLTKYS